MTEERQDLTDELRNTRGSRYGKDPMPGFRSLGRIWRGLLEDWFQVELPDDIPPHVVSLMCVGLKLSRAARPFEKPDTDDYDDSHVYLELSQDMNPTLAHGAGPHHAGEACADEEPSTPRDLAGAAPEPPPAFQRRGPGQTSRPLPRRVETAVYRCARPGCDEVLNGGQPVTTIAAPCVRCGHDRFEAVPSSQKGEDNTDAD